MSRSRCENVVAVLKEEMDKYVTKIKQWHMISPKYELRGGTEENPKKRQPPSGPRTPYNEVRVMIIEHSRSVEAYRPPIFFSANESEN